MKALPRTAALLPLAVGAALLGTPTIADAVPAASPAHRSAAKPAYQVSIRTSAASSKADGFLTVSGKVVGPGAAGKAVTIQRRYVGGSWVSVATATITRSGTYTARVETPRGGTTSFRAVKAGSSSRSAGTSTTRSIPVYRWLYLSDQPGETSDGIRGVDETYDGHEYPHSIDYFHDGYMEFKLAGLCTRLTTVAVYTSDVDGTPAADATLRVGRVEGTSSTFTDTTVASGTPTPIDLSETGTAFRYLNASGTDNSHRMALLDPQVYCNADVLPTWDRSEVD